MDFQVPQLLDATLEELRRGLDDFIFTSVDLVEAYVARIVEVNKYLGAVIELNPDAMVTAQRCDRAKAGPGIFTLPSPLHGIPMLVNDNLASEEATSETAGSAVFYGVRGADSSVMERKLREAGAIILGKTNLSEFSSCRGYEMPEGWSGRGGQTYGAYFPSQNPRGSSSGSAVAVSLGFAWAAVATDLDGSIIMPADANNVVCLRPTVGLTSRYMVTPISRYLDTVGTLSRTVKDAAHLLTAMAGSNARDGLSRAIPLDDNSGLPDYIRACNIEAIRGLRIGVPREYTNTMMQQSQRYRLPSGVLDRVLQMLQNAGAEIVDHVDLPGPMQYLRDQGFFPPDNIVSFPPDLPKRHASSMVSVRETPQQVDPLDRLMHLTRAAPQERDLDKDTAVWGDSPAETVKPAHSIEQQWQRNYMSRYFAYDHDGLPGAFGRLRLDAVVTPTPIAVCLASPNGLPVLTVPVGKFLEGTEVRSSPWPGLVDTAANKPFGISFIGPKFSEATLFGIGFALEQHTMARQLVRPMIVPEADMREVIVRKLRDLALTEARAAREAAALVW